jgi:hypothetical protein
LQAPRQPELTARQLQQPLAVNLSIALNTD